MAELVFDTNLWRAVPEKRWSIGRWRRTLNRLRGKGHTVHASVVNVVELGSHIYERRSGNLRRFRESFQRMREMCEPGVLPDPESEIEIAFGVEPVQPIDEAGIVRLVRIASLAPSVEALIDGFNCNMEPGGAMVRARAGEQSLADFRMSSQDAFVQDVIDHVIEVINPGSLAALRSGKMGHVQNSGLRQRLLALINGPLVLQQIGAALRLKARVGIAHGGLGRLTPYQGVPPALDAYARYYQTVLNQVVATGYNPMKRRNDFWDWQLLTHLHAGRILVTYDANLRSRIAGSHQSNQIVSGDELDGL